MRRPALPAAGHCRPDVPWRSERVEGSVEHRPSDAPVQQLYRCQVPSSVTQRARTRSAGQCRGGADRCRGGSRGRRVGSVGVQMLGGVVWGQPPLSERGSFPRSPAAPAKFQPACSSGRHGRRPPQWRRSRQHMDSRPQNASPQTAGAQAKPPPSLDDVVRSLCHQHGPAWIPILESEIGQETLIQRPGARLPLP